MSPTTLEGQTLGKYQILEPLGRGGMAQVYRAYHPQLDRYVAIKILRADLIDEPEFPARFRREARSVAGLRHPHIVQVYDFDVQDDYYYMVMELLAGDTLKARLNRQRLAGEALPIQVLTRILVDALDGLGFAHAEGITHRDVKPSNILLTRRGEAVITDFGIAQIVGGTSYTLSGALMGTPHYMSPEQGLGEKVDHRSDLYSLGIVLYETLAGHPPFEADTPLAILMKHLHDPLPLPGDPAHRLPAPFEPVLVKALAKRPEERYQSAAEMSAALTAAAAACGASPEPATPVRTFGPAAAAEPAGDTPVYSGTARQNLTNTDFAADETDANLAQHLDVAALRQANASEDAAESRPVRRRVAQAALTGAGVVAGGNLLAVALGIFSGSWALYRYGWPAELLLVSILLLLLMAALPAIWLLIPGGILLGNGVLLGYYALSGNWGGWAFLWPLEPLLVLGLVGLTFTLARRPDQARSLARRLGVGLAGIAGAMVIVVGWVALLMGAVARLFQR
jgi:serine/threonine-protein kinase